MLIDVFSLAGAVNDALLHLIAEYLKLRPCSELMEIICFCRFHSFLNPDSTAQLVRLASTSQIVVLLGNVLNMSIKLYVKILDLRLNHVNVYSQYFFFCMPLLERHDYLDF